MQKRRHVVMVALTLSAGIILVRIGRSDEREKYNSSIMKIVGEAVSVSMNGEDVTDQYKAREQQTKESIAGFLNRQCSEIKFSNYCMLEMDGMTIEAEVENVDYTFLFNIEGELLSVSRSDGKKLKS